MTCEEAEALLEEAAAGSPILDERPELKAHLESCALCGGKYKTASQTVDLVRAALNRLTPGDAFEEKVSGKITALRESQVGLQPVDVDVHTAELTAADPDAKLFRDPAAARESRRLVWVAVIAGVVFIMTLIGLIFLIIRKT
jgi:hypothetical protein